MIFLTVWQILVYYPFVHMIWGGGLLAQWGVIDFAGGIVVHATAGFAALASDFISVQGLIRTPPLTAYRWWPSEAACSVLLVRIQCRK
jgi:hypothetical protein